MRLFFALAFLFSVVHSEDVTTCCKLAHEYLDKNSSPKEEAKFKKDWKNRVDQAQEDRGESPNDLLNRVVVDDLAGKTEKDLSISNRIKIARYYLMYRENKYYIPEKLREYLTDENLKKVFEI